MLPASSKSAFQPAAAAGAPTRGVLFEEESLRRSVAEGGRLAPLRFPITVLVSFFLYSYVGVVEWIAWLAVTLTLETMGLWTRSRVAARDARFYLPHVLVVLLVSISWVAHAVMLWRVGGDVPLIAAMIDLFSVALYGVIAAHKDLRLMLALLAPPLVALPALVIGYLLQNTTPFVAGFASLATIGACVTLIANALAMHKADRDLLAANRALADMAEAARAANRAKDNFVANVSHEIRTPLNGVVGVLEVLIETKLTKSQREMVELIDRSASDLERLLSDLLDLSKIESGRIDLDVQAFDLRSTIDAAARLHFARATAKGVGFAIRYDAAAQGSFAGDAARIRQIVSNLVSNAVKFTAEGQVLVIVEVDEPEESEAKSVLRLEVRDTGVGFEVEAAARLFTRFEQADLTIERRFGGIGLGLSISQALAQKMDGRIDARSTPGEGSVFTLCLPLARAEAVAPDPAEPIQTARQTDGRQTAGRQTDGGQTDGGQTAGGQITGGEAEAAPVRVLLAEDNAVNQRVLSLILKALNVEVETVDDGLAAVTAFEAGGYDLVLLDMQMPKMDGLAAARALRDVEAHRAAPRTPIAMVSANAMTTHVQQALDAGCDFHVAKPVTPASLANALRRAAELRVIPPSVERSDR